MKRAALSPARRRTPARPAARPPMPPALPATVQRRLRALTARALHIAWAGGLLRLLAGACALAVAQGMADLLFDLPARTRTLFLLADAALLVWLVVRHGVLPWRRRLSPDAAALLAQRRWPEFRSSLISAVQLARHPNGSPAMLAVLQQQVATQAGRTDLRLAVPWRGLRTLLWMTLALLATVGLLVWRTAPTSAILARRALLANLPLPTRTVVVAGSRDLSISPGEGVELSARARGEIPRSGRLEITYAGRSTETVAVTPKATDPNLFSLALPNVQQPLAYRFYLGDGRGPEWRVSLLHPPALQSVRFRAVYPPYTGLPEAAAAPGSLRFLAGSRLQITARASQPLQGARVLPQGGGVPVDLRITGPDRTELQGELPITAPALTGFSLALRSARGTASRDDTLYAVEVIPDQPPEITVAPDQAEKSTLVATARPGLRFTVRDDFLVQKVFLCVEPADALAEGENPDPAKAKRVPIEIKQPAASLTFDFVWNDPEKTMKWQEGNTFYYWIEAVDNNSVTGPGVTRTGVREWSVVSLKTKRDELTESLRRSADSIENLSRTQEELRARVGNLLRQNDPKAP